MPLAIDKAADAIVDLINSRPRTPTKAEIAAVIANAQARALVAATFDTGKSL